MTSVHAFRMSTSSWYTAAGVWTKTCLTIKPERTKEYSRSATRPRIHGSHLQIVVLGTTLHRLVPGKVGEVRGRLLMDDATENQSVPLREAAEVLDSVLKPVPIGLIGPLLSRLPQAVGQGRAGLGKSQLKRPETRRLLQQRPVVGQGSRMARLRLGCGRPGQNTADQECGYRSRFQNHIPPTPPPPRKEKETPSVTGITSRVSNSKKGRSTRNSSLRRTLVRRMASMPPTT